MASAGKFEAEIARLRYLFHSLQATTSPPELLKLIREAKEAVQLAIALLESPHPKDTVLMNAITLHLMSVSPVKLQIPGRSARYWIKDQRMFDTCHDMFLDLFGKKFEELELKNDR